MIERFEVAAQELPRKVRKVVRERIREYVDGKLPAARRKQFRREYWQQPHAA